MSNPYKIVALGADVYSLEFEKGDIDFVRLRQSFLSFTTQLSEVTFTFNRLHLFFHRSTTIEEVRSFVDEVMNVPLAAKPPQRLWRLPICFAPTYTADLVDCFEGNMERVHHYHSNFLQGQYRLVFYGFLPGFGYFDGLPEALHLARKSSPTHRTPQGTVAVGGAQLGIYPQDSPGGWQGIGHCPVSLFMPTQTPPVLLQPNDEVVFFEVDKRTHAQIVEASHRQEYQPQSVVL